MVKQFRSQPTFDNRERITTVFDIEGVHIAQLNDADLRTLISRLCEAELGRLGLPKSYVTSGGDQDAPDGGIDVRVSLPSSTIISGFIPRPATGFQVKTSDMPRSAIVEEMCPNNMLRPVIKELASTSGAYIVVSAQGSTSDSSLQKRRDGMREALAALEDPSALITDFYDRGRIATWVRDYPGIVTWVRGRINQPFKGWRTYGNWAGPSEAVDATYLLDEHDRIYDGQSAQDGALPIKEGIRRIRSIVTRPRSVVRIVGLSGTGKTRLVQALFDSRLGDQAIDPSLAVYTDLADEPDPSPKELILQFVQNNQRAVIIVDNCPPDTHKTLTSFCLSNQSTLSLITVEYDVADDQPESTDVFRLDPASAPVIENLIASQAPQLSQVDRAHIAKHSGGNARIALAIAKTVKPGESIVNLRDSDLFKRLFHQRRDGDANLLQAAEVCSLVYSFNGSALDGEFAELPLLAELADLPPSLLYRCITELHSRQLIQQRGVWKALLPQALANRLARQALENIHPQRLQTILLSRAPERMLRSFSRRLGFLHESTEAQTIVRSWLSPGGLLWDISKLSPVRNAMFENIAPVIPEATLEAIERRATGDDPEGFLNPSKEGQPNWVSLLRSLAYEPDCFEKAALLLSRIVKHHQTPETPIGAGEQFIEMFYITLSGTLAPLDRRLRVVDVLLKDHDALSHQCALYALEGLLKTSHFSTSHQFHFGAHSRNYGWSCKTREEIVAWYLTSIEYTKRLAVMQSDLGNKARKILAKSFRGLWTDANMVEEMESACVALVEQGFWPEGWVAVRQTIAFDADRMSDEHLMRLRTLERSLRPDNLLEKIQTYVLNQYYDGLEVADGELDEDVKTISPNYGRAEEIAEELGREVAANPDILDVILPTLVRNEGARKWEFGSGLARGVDNLFVLWKRILGELDKTAEGNRDIQLLRGFLAAAHTRDSDGTEELLDAALEDALLGPWFPPLQASVRIGERGAQRLESALNLGLAPPWTYQYLSRGRVTDSVPSHILRRLIIKIALLEKGYPIAAKILRMKIHSLQTSESDIDDELALCGRELVRICDFKKFEHGLDNDLEVIVAVCFRGDRAADDATYVCRHLNTALSIDRIYSQGFKKLIKSLLRTQPSICLNEFLGNESQAAGMDFVDYSYNSSEQSLLDIVSSDVLTSWAQIDPLVRFQKVAAAIVPFKEVAGTIVWTPTALEILNRAPDQKALLSQFASHLRPRSWSGSLASILEARRTLLRELMLHEEATVKTWAHEQDAQLVQQIKQEKENERLRQRRTDQTFE